MGGDWSENAGDHAWSLAVPLHWPTVTNAECGLCATSSWRCGKGQRAGCEPLLWALGHTEVTLSCDFCQEQGRSPKQQVK